MRVNAAIRMMSLAGAVFWVTATATQPAAKPVDIRDLMTASQFENAGLSKLSPQQIQAFNAWLNSYLHTAAEAVTTGKPVVPPVSQNTATPVTAPAAASAASFGADTLPSREKEAAQIDSHIAGAFTGWTGETVFKLDNGQLWKQAGPGYFADVRLQHPHVVIKKLAFGYLLTLPGHSETVFVRRLQ